MRKLIILLGVVMFCSLVSAGNFTFEDKSGDELVTIYDSGNITAHQNGWFQGLFNWTTLTNWLSFDGAILSFNDTLLNQSLDGRYVRKTGDNMTGALDMGNNNITNLHQLRAPDGSVIRFNANGNFSGFDQAIVIQSNQTLGAGVITHALLDNQGTKVIEAWQSGKNNSAGFHRNSYLIFGDLNITNASILTDAIQMWSNIGISAEYDYDTANQGAALGVQYGIETQKLHLHDSLGEGEFSGEGEFTWLGRAGTDFDIYNVPLHLRIPRLENVTFGIGFVELFEIDWSGESTGQQPPPPFSESGVGSGSSNQEWSTRNDARCNSNPCVRAKGANDGDIRGMDYNFSTLNISAMFFSFYYGSNNMDAGAADNFSVFMNNNEGSGWVMIFNDTTTNAEINPPILKVFNLTTLMDNKTLVSLRFNHQATNNNEESFVDNVLINGTAGTPTIIEVMRNDARIELGGSTFTDTQCEIFYNDSSTTIEIGRDPNCNVEIFNATFTTINVGSQNITGDLVVSGNVTANWFNGLFNWFIDAGVSQNYLTFNGSTLTFDESNLNSTINDYGIKAGFNDTFNSTYANYAFNVSLNHTQITFNLYNSTWDNRALINLINTTANIEALGFVQGAHTTDTSASVDCAGDEVLLGNGSCQDSSTFGGGGGGTDTRWDIIGSRYLINQSNILDANESLMNSTFINEVGNEVLTGSLNITEDLNVGNNLSVESCINFGGGNSFLCSDGGGFDFVWRR